MYTVYNILVNENYIGYLICSRKIAKIGSLYEYCLYWNFKTKEMFYYVSLIRRLNSDDNLELKEIDLELLPNAVLEEYIRLEKLHDQKKN